MPNLNCYVQACRNKVVFRFPKDASLRKEWLIAIGRYGDSPKPDHGLCADHFTPEDLITVGFHSGMTLTRKRLKRGAIPFLAEAEDNLPTNKRSREGAYDPIEATFSSTQQKDPNACRPSVLRGIPPLRWLNQDDHWQSGDVLTGDLDQCNASFTDHHNHRSIIQFTTNANHDKDPLRIEASPSRDDRKGTCIVIAGQIRVKAEGRGGRQTDTSSTSQSHTKQEEEVEDDVPPMEPHYTAEILNHMVRKLRRDVKRRNESLGRKANEVAMLTLSNRNLSLKIRDLQERLREYEDSRPLSDSRVSYLVEKSFFNSKDPSYSLVKAEKELRNLQEKAMPKHWSFIVIPAGILLLYANRVGESVWPVSKCVTLQPDMRLDIQVVNAPPPKLNLGQMRCIVDILCAMKTVASLRVCVGVGGKCTSDGYLEQEAHVGRERCDACLKESLRLANLRKEAKLTLDPEEENQKAKQLAYAKKRIAAYKKKLDLAEDEIIRLKTENIRLKKLRDARGGTAVGNALDSIGRHFRTSK